MMEIECRSPYHDAASLTSKMLELGSIFTLMTGLSVSLFTVGHGIRYRRARKGESKETALLNAILFATWVRKV